MNRAINLASKLLSTPWNIDQARGRLVIGAIVHALVRNQRPESDVFGDPLPCMQIAGPVALIPLCGYLAIDVPDWIKQYGINLTDADDIEEEIEEALEDENVELLVFDVDSGGGMALAGDKLFDVIEAANKKKKCFAFCADGHSMCSSAYEAAAGCTAILAGWYALGIGAIGSYLAYLDDTQFWAQLGITFEIFKSGDVKGIGESVPLNQAQKDFLQESVARAGATIRRNVSKYRTGIASEDLQGQWFDGREAARRGFAAGCVDDLSAAIAKFRRM